MKTYVELKNFDNKFADIEGAIAFAEKKELETAEIFIFAEDGTILETQDCERNPNSDDLVYYTWGIFGYYFFDDGYRIESTDMLAGRISSEQEVKEIAETLREKFSGYDLVTVEHYSQTISENIGDVDLKDEIYRAE